MPFPTQQQILAQAVAGQQGGISPIGQGLVQGQPQQAPQQGAQIDPFVQQSIIDRQRQMAELLQQRASQPAGTALGVVGNVLNQISGLRQNSRASRAEANNAEIRQREVSRLIAGEGAPDGGFQSQAAQQVALQQAANARQAEADHTRALELQGLKNTGSANSGRDPARRVFKTITDLEGNVHLVMGDGKVRDANLVEENRLRVDDVGGVTRLVDVRNNRVIGAVNVAPGADQGGQSAQSQGGLDTEEPPDIVDAQEIAQNEIEIENIKFRGNAQLRSKALSSLQTINNDHARQTRQIDELIAEADGSFGGNVGANAILGSAPLPTNARRFNRKLETIKASVSFAALTEMRNNSPTGGAVGQLSDPEREALANSIAALDAASGEEAIKAALGDVKDKFNAFHRVTNDAFSRDFGTDEQFTRATADDGLSDELKERYGLE